MVLHLQASSDSERFQALWLLLQLLPTLLRGRFALGDEQLHRAASGEHGDIAAMSHATNISLGLGMPPNEVAASELCSPKRSSVRR